MLSNEEKCHLKFSTRTVGNSRLVLKGDLDIINNPKLSDCCSIAHLLDNNPDNDLIEREIRIEGNPSFCNSVEEVLANCEDTTSVCDEIELIVEDNSIRIPTFPAPIEIGKIFNKNWELVYECFGNCPDEYGLSDTSGEPTVLHVQIDNYDANWNFLCHFMKDVQLTPPASESRESRLQAADFLLAPNPALTETFIDLEKLKGEAVSLKIINHFGQEVYQKDLEKVVDFREKIDISSFSNRLYLLQIQPKGSIAVSKTLMISRLY